MTYYIHKIKMDKVGGKRYGEGYFGVAYDACKLHDPDSFCSLAKFQTAEQVILYGLDNEKTITTMENFRKHTKGLKDYVVKVFKSNNKSKQSFLEEVASMRQIYKVLTAPDINTYTALPHRKSLIYEKMPYLALSTNNGMYATYARRCTTDLKDTTFTDAMVKQLIDDLLPAVEALRKRGFAHCDLKPENIMYSAGDKRFKLIDWGLSRFLTTPSALYTPNEFGCPLGHYISGTHPLLALGKFYQSNLFTLTTWSQSDIFIDVLKHIAVQTIAIVETRKTVDELFSKYAGLFDKFSFGLVIAYVVWNNGLDWNRHRETCLRLITLPI